ncbi:MAG: SCO family protein [Myxococcota bacterium]
MSHQHQPAPLFATCVAVFVVLLGGNLCLAHPPQVGSNVLPKQLQGSQVVADRIGSFVPLDIALTNERGEPVTLQHYFNITSSRPVILTLGYYRCPMLCSFVMGALVKALQQIPLQLGKHYSIVSVSIDPKETPQTAALRRESFVKPLLQQPASPTDLTQADWHFHVTTQQEAQRLAQAVGFGYRYDKASNQYAHAAAIFILSPNGKLNRILYGVEYPPPQLQQALKEASAGIIGRLFERVVLSCFHYDPSSHRYGIYIFGITRLFAALTVAILIAAVLTLHIKERWKLQQQKRRN